MSEWLTKKELADHLKIKPGTIAIWARTGKIPAVRVSPKVIRFDLAEVMKALSGQKGGRP